ncbi:hypothetical protein BKA62DRAFT_699153 [Auriculariales sp. MPI-PUGE-AT-0066]|nr:hypothetical protein BKA62DRAFT_699153 [Auriculariales sp. MPI-PUGE-AT-0066]
MPPIITHTPLVVNDHRSFHLGVGADSQSIKIMMLPNMNIISEHPVLRPSYLAWMRTAEECQSRLLARSSPPVHQTQKHLLGKLRRELSYTSSSCTSLTICMPRYMSALQLLFMLVHVPRLTMLRLQSGVVDGSSAATSLIAQMADLLPDWPLQHLQVSVVPLSILQLLLQRSAKKTLQKLFLYSSFMDSGRAVKSTWFSLLEPQISTLEGLRSLEVRPREQYVHYTFCEALHSLFLLKSLRHLHIAYDVLSTMNARSTTAHPVRLPNELRILELYTPGLYDDSENATRLNYLLQDLARGISLGQHPQLCAVCIVIPGRYLDHLSHMEFPEIFHVCADRRIAFTCADNATMVTHGFYRMNLK